jgi:hypothetical protein
LNNNHKKNQTILTWNKKKNKKKTHLKPQKYMKPMMEKSEEIDVPIPTIKKLFSNINLIFNVNSQLLKDIGNRLKQLNDLTVIGDIFVDVVRDFFLSFFHSFFLSTLNLIILLNLMIKQLMKK